MFSNYPPGVTGLEPQIAGQDAPERDVVLTDECQECGFLGDGSATQIHYDIEITTIWECPECGTEMERTDPIENFHDN